MPYNLDIPGWMPEAELKILERLASTVPENGATVEVGSFCGRSSWCLAKSMPQSATLTCLDIWDPSKHPYTPPSAIGPAEFNPNDFGLAATIEETIGNYDNFKRNTLDCPNIISIQGKSPNDFIAWPEASLDFVFLDGVHHNPVFAADLHHWMRRVKPGGIIAGDDCARTHPDVLWTVHDTCKQVGWDFAVLSRIWVVAIPPRTLTAF